MLKKILQQLWKHREPYLFLFPTLLALIAILVIPLLQGMYMSLLDSSKTTLALYLRAPFVGLSHYWELFLNSDSELRAGFWRAALNTLYYTILVTGISMTLGLVSAQLLNRSFLGRNLARVALLVPWILPSYVVGMLWGFMWMQEQGIVNILLFDFLHWDKISALFGVQWEYVAGEVLRPRWLTGENTLWAIVVPSVWRLWPFCMILFVAGLGSIPAEVYEAAELDGASPMDRFLQITFPLLRPIFALLILFCTIFNVYSFNIIIMMFGNGSGYPGKFGDLVMTNIFRNSFQMWNMGLGAAMSTTVMTIMLVGVLLWYRHFREDISGG